MTDHDVSPQEAEAIAREAMVFGYAPLLNYKTLHEQTQDPASPSYIGGFNRYRHYTRSYTADDTTIVTPNNDTPYSWAWFDLRREPVVLSVPAVSEDRYYVVQLIDLFTFIYAYVGLRTTGPGAGDYLLAGPDWDGEVPDGVADVIRSETEFTATLTRTALYAPDDMPAVRAVQHGYRITPLSEYAGLIPPPPAPEVDFPVWDEEKALSGTGMVEYLDFILRFVSPVPAERDLYGRLARIGIGPDATSGQRSPGAEVVAAIDAGARQGVADIEEALANQHSSHGIFGSREQLGTDYLHRSMGAMGGIYGMTPEESVYTGAHQDADGALLDGSKGDYVWRFTGEEMPDARFFWSVTLYRLPGRLLAANPIDRYSIGDRTPGVVRGEDGGFEIWLSHDEPDDPVRRANWLPTPSGPFDVIMRIYGPDEDVASGRWEPPPVEKVSG